MCPPNNPPENFTDEENELFTIDFNSIYDAQLFDAPCTLRQLFDDASLNGEVWAHMDAESSTSHGDTLAGTPTTEHSNQGSFGDGSIWNPQRNNLSSVGNCGSNSEDHKPIEQTKTQFIENEFLYFFYIL